MKQRYSSFGGPRSVVAAWCERTRRSASLLVLLLASSVCLAADPLKAKPEVVEQWKDMRFGMFICWGPVTLTGKEIGWSRGNPTPVEEYDALYKKWNPEKFDASEWAKVVKDTGCKYVVFLTKHHDGFCLWDTKQTDYNIMNGQFKRDITKELAVACREAGIGFFPYYSTCDWHHPDFPVTSPGGKVQRPTSNLDRYTDYLEAQVKELITGCGPLVGIWFDVPQRFDRARGERVIRYVRSLQPNILVNNRTGAPGDFDTPEQHVGRFQNTRPWESCITLGTQWTWKPDDKLKSYTEAVRMLVVCTTGDGNLALNTNPMPDGQIEPRQIENFRKIGEWLRKYGESIYGTRGGPFVAPDWKKRSFNTDREHFAVPAGNWWGGSTHKGNAIYLHILRWPSDTITLPAIKPRILRHTVLTGGEANVKQIDTGIEVSVPATQRDAVDTIVKLELDSPSKDIPVIIPKSTLVKSLTTGKKATASNWFQKSDKYSPDKAAAAQTPLHIGFVDPALPKNPPPRNAAALAFAQSQGEVARIAWQTAGGWLAPDGRIRAPEEFDVIWFHQGDDLYAAKLDTAAGADLMAWLEGGGALLVSGAAGRVLNDLGIEPTPLRVLGASGAAFVSGIRVLPKHREHPAFAGLDVTQLVPLTTKGGNALADFYGTAGPGGELLANGSGASERPLVEYTVGSGRVIFVGWRLPDFTTAADAHRPNLERLFSNLLGYLASKNVNHARLVAPAGKSRYERRMGVPFLLANKPVELTAAASGEKTAVIAEADVRESAISGERVTAKALGLTLSQREKPVAQFVVARRAEQEAVERKDREMMAGLSVIKPDVKLLPAPLTPLVATNVDQSVLLGRSAAQAPGDGKGDITPVYEPVEDGGFRIKDSKASKRKLNTPIVHGQNRIWTGDVPLFRMDTVTGLGSYAKDERVFPLWARPDAHIGGTTPSMGTLRLGVPGAGGKTNWLDEQSSITTTFRPGYTEYQLAGARVTIAPALDSHGFVCRVEFDKETPLLWQYGGIWWLPSEANKNHVEFAGGIARITEPNLPNGLVLAAWDGEGDARTVTAAFGQQAEFVAKKPRRVYHIVATWGITRYDEERARNTMARLDTPNAAAWPEKRDELKKLWFDCYIGRALEPEKHLRQLLAAPADELRRTRDSWDARRAEFQIRTPDARLNALINWARCISEYHRQGPGLVLGGHTWQMYSHISTGWYGKQWAGDHAAMEECLRFYAAMQGDNGFIRWISPSLVAFNAENNTAFWVDQVWRHYQWTGNRQFVRDMWPAVQKAVAWMRATNDPDGDGLFRDGYEFWNCDSNGKGPKSAAPSAMSWAMLDRTAQMATVVGDAKAEAEYRALAEKTHTAIFRELWNEKEGRLGSIGSDGIWRGHPQIWEEFLAINAGLLNADQSRRAMRWIASHYGFEPQPGVKLLSCSDWWPLRWSVQWVPTGDTCLAALAGMKGGDADLWWPFLKTVVGSAFRSDFPGINMGISNAGAGGGHRENVDSTDPHMHVAVRGLFGIEPALHEGRLDICPAFPSDWREASIRTPDVSYEWKREGDLATFRIHTPKPVVKRVRTSLGGEEIVTPSETESVISVKVGPAALPPEPAKKKTILADQLPPSAPTPLTAVERSRLVLFDLASACNVTSEEFVATRFTFDHKDGPMGLSGWWGSPSLIMPPSPRVLTAPHGVVFLTSGRPQAGLSEPPKNLLALASWQPYPLPGGATIAVGQKCERLWLLLQNYVHPMRNYLPNGEVVLRYADGGHAVTSLIPPFNLDCYFQHFSLEGVPVPFGQRGPSFFLYPRIMSGFTSAHANALAIDCDPSRVLESVELRATCSEAVIGLAGMTALAPKAVSP